MRGVFFAVAKDWEIMQQCRGGGKKKKKNRIRIFFWQANFCFILKKNDLIENLISFLKFNQWEDTKFRIFR